MKTIKILIVIAIALATMSAEIPQVAGTPYTPDEAEWGFSAMRKGSVKTIIAKDDKGRVTGSVRNTVIGIYGDASAFAVESRAEMFDDKGEPVEGPDKKPMTVTSRVVVEGGTMYLDLESMFDAALKGLGGSEKVEISSVAVKMPTEMAVGQTLEDASMRMKMGFVGMSVEMTDGQVLARETVTTPAGTFDCFKVSQNVTSSAMGFKERATEISWYARGVGAVKSQTLDKNGKVTATEELTEYR